MGNESLERWITTLLVAFVIFVSSVIAFSWLQNEITSKHIDSLMSYCEKITGKSQASFNSDGTFIGCETVVK